MPWTDLTPMDQRLELVTLALSGEFTVTELASRFGVSKKTAHKWIGRYEAGGAKALEDQSRAPRHSPQKTPDDMERLIVKLKRGPQGQAIFALCEFCAHKPPSPRLRRSLQSPAP